MALIKCSECQKDISDKAPSCPGCGNPISGQNVTTVKTDSDMPLKIEPVLTSKRWKWVKIISGILIISGFIIPAFLSGSPEMGQGFGWLLVFIGIVGYLIGKIGAWYADRTAR